MKSLKVTLAVRLTEDEVSFVAEQKDWSQKLGEALIQVNNSDIWELCSRVNKHGPIGPGLQVKRTSVLVNVEAAKALRDITDSTGLSQTWVISMLIRALQTKELQIDWCTHC